MQRQNIFEQPAPHRTKATFRKNKVPYWQLAKALHASEATISRWLNGVVPTPKEIDEQLAFFARRLEQ